MPPGQFGHHPELPALTAGVTLLDVDDDLGLEPLHTLVIDRLLTTKGPAHWLTLGATPGRRHSAN